eukprot:CAMPEP_0185833424 /NCGR_PEP_ID=MMETSP1353-20130828/2792_1 /TAXON_ID=1077150 /ORGANISM="Erythrolobus australicus, Strain CCMP3124" /LENGTH=340 /DNA_ID=CAMNT_0028531713 /DNA_START=43 /DNA_END=1065 /DNA_ORIENTATION=+
MHGTFHDDVQHALREAVQPDAQGAAPATAAVAHAPALNLGMLPDDLLTKCISFAAGSNVQEICRLSAVSQSFRAVAQRNSFAEVTTLHFSFPKLVRRSAELRAQVENVIRKCVNTKELSFSGNEWLVDDSLIELIGKSMRRLERLDLNRCQRLRGSTFASLNSETLRHLSLESCHYLCSERLLTTPWRHDPLQGAETPDASETEASDISSPSQCRARRRSASGLVFPNLERLEISHATNVDDKYLTMLGRYGSKLKFLKLRGCANVTMRGVHSLCVRLASLRTVDVAFCPQLDVQLLTHSFECAPVSQGSTFFSLDDWTPCGFALFTSQHRDHSGLTFIL